MTTLHLTSGPTSARASDAADFSVTEASSFIARGRGLLGRRPLEASHGLLIRPCNSVHTCFMRQSLDLVGLTALEDDGAEITWLSQDVRPWRFRWARRGTKQILELPAGEIGRVGLRVGQRLRVAR